MAVDQQFMTCRQPGCDGPRSGVCINNLPFVDCPDVIEAPPPGEPEPSIPTVGIANPDTVELPGGRALDAVGCDALLRRRGGIVVGLVAGPEAGKTTLIATLYELLHRRRMLSFGFAGSETLRGLEERCHLARITSNATKPDTSRTPTKARLSFIHIEVAKGKDRFHLILSDRSGEHFRDALAKPAEIGSFEELDRADVLLVLIDLNELVRDTQVQISNARRLIMAMDQHLTLAGKRVILVGTKTDLAVTPAKRRGMMRAYKELVADLTARVQQDVSIDSVSVACRPLPGQSIIGDGVEPLLAAMLSPAQTVHSAASTDDSWPHLPAELDRLMLSYRNKNL